MRAEEYVVLQWANHLQKLILAHAKRDLRNLGRDSMLSGDDSPLLNVWEEVCVQMQGEESLHWWAYEDVIDRVLLDKVEQLDRAALLALWAQTEDGFEWLHEHHADEDGPEAAPVDRDAVVEYLRPLLLEIATDEENDRVSRFLHRGEEYEEEDYWKEQDQ